MVCRLAVVGVLTLVVASTALAAERHVGPGRTYATPAEAIAAAAPGDTVLVHPPGDGVAYEGVAVRVRTPRLTIRAVGAAAVGPSAAPAVAGARLHHPFGPSVTLSGRGAALSGVGPAGRAILQFDPTADGCTVEGFVLAGAANGSGNAAGVRINGADDVTIRGCEIHGCDMGVMSAAGSATDVARSQTIDTCHIHHNGSAIHAGYNHNLYLGGESATVIGCRIDHATTGHNLKSRAHLTRVAACFLHDAANRDFDLVEASETAAPGSDAVLLGNLIVKRPDATGNRTVVHFGADGGGMRRGTLHVAFNTIATPFVSPVVELSSPEGHLSAVGNVVTAGDARQANQVFASVRAGATLARSAAIGNVLSPSFEAKFPAALSSGRAGSGIANRFDLARTGVFADAAADDYHPRPPGTALLLPGPLAPRLSGGGTSGPTLPLDFEPRRDAGTAPRATRPAVIGAFGLAGVAE